MSADEFDALFQLLIEWAEERKISQTEMMQTMEYLLLSFYLSCGFNSDIVDDSCDAMKIAYKFHMSTENLKKWD